MLTSADVIRRAGASPTDVAEVATRERRELARRELAYRGERPPLDVAGKVVLVVDDGLATGATMKVAVHGLRTLRPRRVVAAVPVASEPSCRELRRVADEVVCAKTPAGFSAVGGAYRTFDQTSDEEVKALLATRTTREGRWWRSGSGAAGEPGEITPGAN